MTDRIAVPELVIAPARVTVPDRIVAIDWSGAKGDHRIHKGIAVAEWIPAQPVQLKTGWSREQIAEYLQALARRTPKLVVGFDFAFGFPEWFGRRYGSTISEVWQQAAEHGEQWLAGVESPFWRTRRRPASTEEPALRQTDMDAALGKPKSIFQLVGNGQVGPGSVRGMKVLDRLRSAGFAVWPFDRARFPLIVEIYPTSCYKNGARTGADLLTRELVDSGLEIDAAVAATLHISPDARDAACALMRMVDERASFLALPAVTDPATLLEGRTWRPGLARSRP